MDFHNRKRGIYLTLDYKAKAPKIDRNGVEMEVQSRYEDRHVLPQRPKVQKKVKGLAHRIRFALGGLLQWVTCNKGLLQTLVFQTK